MEKITKPQNFRRNLNPNQIKKMVNVLSERMKINALYKSAPMLFNESPTAPVGKLPLAIDTKPAS